jgi:hypothetical protein
MPTKKLDSNASAWRKQVSSFKKLARKYKLKATFASGKEENVKVHGATMALPEGLIHVYGDGSWAHVKESESQNRYLFHKGLKGTGRGVDELDKYIASQVL